MTENLWIDEINAMKTQLLECAKPRCVPPLDTSFRPAVLVNRAYQKRVAASGAGQPLVIGLQREAGALSRFETLVFPDDHPQAADNLLYVERLVKFLLWQRGGWKLYIGGPQRIGQAIAQQYFAQGSREFDADFMGNKIYEQPFTVIVCAVSEVPAAHECGRALGRSPHGYRIGFDLGASDRKVSAVVDGKAIYSEEVVWAPRQHSDPEYHYHEVLTALKTAREKLPRLDTIGGSSAGIYVDNRPMVASLFRGVPPEKFEQIKTMFQRLQEDFGVPLEIINDGDVTALAGSMSLGANGVLGIALGSSEASGYVDAAGNITGWLNELAFAPVDYSPRAPRDEWSGDRGCGASYFSQQCVFRLAPQVGIEIPSDITDAAKLKFVQRQLEAGSSDAQKIWQTMGVYMGYALAYYADFYAIQHVLILGRCTSGRGGALILQGAQRVLSTEFPELAERIEIHLPSEKIRRVGQSIAAASLPLLKQ